MADVAADRLAAAGLSVLVTGASGFIGSHVLTTLADAGVRVTGLVRSAAGARRAASHHALCRIVDVGDAAAVRVALRAAAPDCVLHLAADAIRREVPAAGDPPDNAAMTQTLLEALAAEAPAAAFVLASSEAVYGPGREAVFDEDSVPAPADAYAESKLHCEALTQRLWVEAGRRAVSVRLSNIYGGGDRHLSRLVPGAVRAVLQSERPVLRSNPGVTRDFLYIDDALRGVLALAAELCLGPRCETVVNIASGVPVSIAALATRIAELAGRPELAPAAHLPREELPVRRIAIERARRVAGWTPTVDLHEGLARTVDWYRDMAAAIGEP